MNIAIQQAKWKHEDLFLRSIAKTAVDIGHKLTPASKADVVIQWGVSRDAGANPPPALHCELGWLPRWSYQVSHKGINAAHHRARARLEKLTREQVWKVNLILTAAREGKGMPSDWGYMQRGKIENAPKSPYVLAPLQMANDVNMDHVPEQIRTNQQFIDYVSECELPHPVYFKQHPNSQAKDQIGLKVRRKQDHIWRHKDGSVYQLLESSNVVAVVARNSNVVHDALLYHTPTVALARGIWPPKVFGDAMSLRYFAGFLADWCREPWRKHRESYVHWLGRVQWKLSDAADPQRVEAALREATN